MFYLKVGKKKRYIEDCNTFTTCIGCGREMQISLEEAVIDGRLDIYGTGFYCPACGKQLRNGYNDCEVTK